MQIVKSLAAMQRLAWRWRRQGVRVGLVPTMGYLHEGHLSLIGRARRRIGARGRVVVSIYVNPMQFGPREDFTRYPRDWKRDLKLCRAVDVDVVFAPHNADMYPGGIGRRPYESAERLRLDPGGYSTYVVEERLSQGMEGAARPRHFRGVTTVVAKLFHLVQPEFAVFGAKDFQQAAVIRRMVRDLNFPVKIVVAPTVREPDGVALSSRNRYLAGRLRPQAVVLHRAIQAVRAAVAQAAKPVAAGQLRALVRKIMATAPAGRLDYVEFFDPDSLAPVVKVRRGAQMALAVSFGKTRLIDNGRI